MLRSRAKRSTHSAVSIWSSLIKPPEDSPGAVENTMAIAVYWTTSGFAGCGEWLSSSELNIQTQKLNRAGKAVTVHQTSSKIQTRLSIGSSG